MKEALKNVRAVAVMDRAMSFGGPGGPLFMDMAAVFYGETSGPLMADFIYGLGGRDISVADFREVVKTVYGDLEAGAVREPVRFVGLRG